MTWRDFKVTDLNPIDDHNPLRKLGTTSPAIAQRGYNTASKDTKEHDDNTPTITTGVASNTDSVHPSNNVGVLFTMLYVLC
ncbi:MAG TPA: hypothetical protein VM260_27295 [Pirellula sp.]|nr:hypothetical protein [Pirellula sp.]